MVRVNYLLQITKAESQHQIMNVLSTESPLAGVIRSINKNKLKEHDLQNMFNPGFNGTISKDVALIKQHRKEIVHLLEPAYSTMMEILEFRNHLRDLIDQMDKFQIELHISL